MSVSASEAALALPTGVSEQSARDLAERHAPTLRLHCDEEHFPGDPDVFRVHARFRESRWGPDRGWHKLERAWHEGKADGAPYFDISWTTIVDESLGAYDAPDPFAPDSVRNLRPRDWHNRNGSLSSRGLFLELGEDAGFSPGTTAVARRIDAPIFADIAYNAQHGRVRALYWFFYYVNWTHGFHTHQGDWEHVTWVWRVDAFRAGASPDWAHFAQHDSGVTMDFAKLQRDPEHPNRRLVFVNRHGHPSEAYGRPPDFPHRWFTWNDVRWVADHDWRDFAGAWGAVGSSPFTTGPLGPRFKRHGDNVRIKTVRGRPYVKLGRSER